MASPIETACTQITGFDLPDDHYVTLIKTHDMVAEDPISIVLQIPLSAWWLSRFRFGPVEWIWRRLTYGRPL